MEIRVDRMKLFYLVRRPIPNGTSGLGSWFLILDIISFLSIFSNAGKNLIFFNVF